MEWYLILAICIYLSGGFWCAGYAYSENDDSSFLPFFAFVIFFGFLWPITITVLGCVRLYNAYFSWPPEWYKDWKLKKEEDEVDEDYDDMRLERMGMSDDIWKT
jgi:hypothetical protein